MNITQTALLFFYGIFWASSLGVLSDFHLFDTTGWFKKAERWTSIRRFIISIIIANIFPIWGLYILYNSPLMNIETPKGILISACASLSVFAIPRIVHGIILNQCSAKCFYTEDQIKKLKEKERDADPCFWHLIPGFIYIVGFIGIAWLMHKIIT